MRQRSRKTEVMVRNSKGEEKENWKSTGKTK